MNRYSPPDGAWAVVTGASSGIGIHYASILAQWGWNVVIVSNQEEALDEVSQSINGNVKSLCLDLAADNAPEALLKFCEGLNVKVLVNNAGIFSLKSIDNTSDAEIDLFIDLHIRNFSKICKLFAARMASNGGGYILNMSSLSALMSLPGIALYESSKAYVRTFSRALWYENRERGVSVSVVCPGAIDTALYNLPPRLRRLGVQLGILMNPEKLARIALKAMFKRRRHYIPGVANHIFRPFLSIIPTPIIMAIKRKLVK